MKTSLLLGLLMARSCTAHLVSKKFPGYGFAWYDPNCAFSCHDAISAATLNCTSMEHMGHMGPTPPHCYATDTAYLTTLAYCMKTHCDEDNVPTFKREEFWATKFTGDPDVMPKWDYATSLAMVEEPPTIEYNLTAKILNQTMLLPQEAYDIQYKFNTIFDHMEMLQAKYCFVLVTIGFGTPIFFTLLARLPYMTRALEAIRPYLVYPSIIGTYQVRPLPWLLGNAPTIGQALYIFMFFAINIILSAVNYSTAQPHPWGFPPKEEILAYIGYRTGHISYALLPLVVLFSGRNNFLLWITNWSHLTYILLHRWIARIFAAHAIIHSVTLLVTYKGVGTFTAESKKPYWLWGIVATVLVCAMLVFSQLYFRRLAYEIFLALHVLMAVFVIAGCWYHVILRWGYNFYDNWLYAAIAVWFFDYLLRAVRTCKNGLRRAEVTDITPYHVRVDVQGLRWPSKPGYIAYVYFPTINVWRPWENHPFSVNSSALFRSYKHAPTSGSSSDDGQDVEKSTGKAVVASTVATDTTAGLTFFIKKNTGLTSCLKAHNQLPVLIEGPYPQQPSLNILKCDRVLLIGGGIGITGLMAWTRAHPNLKLAWSVKSSAEPLVKEVEVVLKDVAEKKIVIGERLDTEDLLKTEAEAGYNKVGVVVCGPGGMCDNVRARVAGLGRGGKTVFELEVDAYSW